MQDPQRPTRVLLALIVCETIFFDYWEYSRQYHANPGWWMDVVSGTGSAPAQYRIGVPWVADMLRRHGHMGLRHGLTLVDLFCSTLAVWLLLSLFQRSIIYWAATNTGRWFGSAVFVLLIQFYFGWITWYQRPETLASVATVATTLWLLTVPLPFSKTASTVSTVVLILLLAVVQGLVRADILFAFHLGVLIVCSGTSGKGLALTRPMQILTSLVATALIGCIQLILMHKIYPSANYGTTPVFQLILNLTNPLGMIPFLIFMAPYLWLATNMIRARLAYDTPSLSIFAGSVIFLAMWFTVGRIEEVRIFLPYATVLVPFTCTCAMQRFVSVEDENIRTR